MKTKYLTLRVLSSIVGLCLLNTAEAGSPIWTFTPLTNTAVTVTSTGTATIQYTVTNQSTRPHTLEMTRIPGISQTTTAGNCGNPFTLGYQESCTLTLVVTGSALQGNVSGGPKVCQQGNALQCYQPNSSDILNITLSGATPLAIGDSFGGGTVACLTSTGGEANLIAATTDNSAGLIYSPEALNPAIAAASSTTDGAANTVAVVTQLDFSGRDKGTYAAGLCTEYTSEGFSDWFLPAKDQLNCLYQNKDAVGGFASANYWSSTLSGDSAALAQKFSDSGQFVEDIDVNLNVRCVRAFTP